MAQAPVSRKLGLTRDQLAAFLSDHEQIRQFENLFALVDSEVAPNAVTEATILAGSALATANEALAQLNEIIDQLGLQPRNELGTMAALQQANVPWLTFNNAPSPVPTAVGSVYWDGGTTLGVQATANVLIRVGEAEYVYAKASSAITKGQLCYHTGAVGSSGVITVAPTPINLADPNQIVGVAAETIALNAFGLIQISGDLRGFNTTGSSVGETWADGDPLYYNPAFVGSLTKTKPVAPNQKTYIGEVTNAGSGGSGSIHIRIVPGSVLGGTDSNVQISGLANNDALIYIGANSRWENKPPAYTRDALGLGTGTPSNGQLLIGNGTDFTTAALTAGNGIAITNGAGSVTVATSLAAGANISITGTSTRTIAVTGLGTMALENIGVSGSFTTADTPPKTVTVTNGIITSIV